MSVISETVGNRIRAYRKKRGLSQEALAEKADLHPTYIGQIERGAKNMSIATLEKILVAMNLSFQEFFEVIETTGGKPGYAAQCYDLVNSKSAADQARLYHILWEIDQLMETSRMGQSGP